MRVLTFTEPVADFLTRPVPDDLAAPEAWLFRPERPVLVLGSSQRESTADLATAAARGVEVVRRRSGGGAVYVDPETSLWLDVVLPPSDVRWSDDVRVATYWLGEAWQRALARVGIDGEVFHGAVETTPWGRLVCFGSLGPGEVVRDGRKLVGVSQRRTRAGARFQCLAYAEWEPDAVLELLDLAPQERALAAADLGERALGVGALGVGALGVGARLADLQDAVLGELADGGV